MSEQEKGSPTEAGGAGEVPDNAGVVARPPVVYLSSILIGVGLDALWPAEVVPDSQGTPLGLLLVLVALALFVVSVRELGRVGTQIPTNRPTTAIVTTGPYQFSRNPIYLALTVLQLGIGFWVNSAWVLGMLVPTLLVMSFGVIAREERYLERKFAEEYLQYNASVRRWL